MNAEHDSDSARSIARLGDQDLYRAALRAARAGDRETAGRLYLVMADRGMAWAQQREIVETLFPAVRHSPGFLTGAAQRRALGRFERRRR